jgi:hypothetical protein
MNLRNTTVSATTSLFIIVGAPCSHSALAQSASAIERAMRESAPEGTVCSRDPSPYERAKCVHRLGLGLDFSISYSTNGRLKVSGETYYKQYAVRFVEHFGLTTTEAEQCLNVGARSIRFKKQEFTIVCENKEFTFDVELSPTNF